MAEEGLCEVANEDSSATGKQFNKYSKLASTVSVGSVENSPSGTLGEEKVSAGEAAKPTKSCALCKSWRVRQAVKCVVFAAVVCAITGLFSLPTVFFASQPTQEEAVSNATFVPTPVDVCLEPAVYSGATCRAELQVYQECFSGSAGSNGDILIRSDINQETVETDAELLVESGLSFLNPSAECVAAIRPFLCLYLFGVCDSSSQLRQVSSSECVDLRDDICATEWSAAIGFLGPGTLPVCEELPTLQTESCVEPIIAGTSPIEVSGSGLLTENSSVVPSNVNCSSGFYLTDDQLCMPLCGNWVYTEADTILSLLVCCVGVICGIAVYVLTFTVQREAMLTFPTVYLLYLTTSAVLVGGTVVIGYTNKAYLFCSSSDLFESLRNPSHFCSLSGIVYSYGFLQMSLWTVFHVIALFWGLRFPFHYRKVKLDGYIKYIHIVSVVVAVLAPLIPALPPLKDGFIATGTPPLLCSVRNADYTYYLLILPISILLAVSTSFLVLIFWTVLKELVLKKISKNKSFAKAGLAELKITLIFMHYLLLGVVGLVIFTLYVVTQEEYTRLYQEYFLCESLGQDLDCPSFESVRGKTFSALSVVAIVLVALIPFVVLAFTVNAKTVKAMSRKFRKLSSRFTFRSQETSTTSI